MTGFVPDAGTLGPFAEGPFSRTWSPAIAILVAGNVTLLIILGLLDQTGMMPGFDHSIGFRTEIKWGGINRKIY